MTATRGNVLCYNFIINWPIQIRRIGALAQEQIRKVRKQRKIIRREAAYLLESPEQWTEVGNYSNAAIRKHIL